VKEKDIEGSRSWHVGNIQAFACRNWVKSRKYFLFSHTLFQYDQFYSVNVVKSIRSLLFLSKALHFLY
jgi:hypothetical protein